MNILIVYNGSLPSKIALRRAMRNVREYGGKVIVLVLLQEKLFIDYDDGSRAEVIASDGPAHWKEEIRNLIGIELDSVSVKTLISEGNPEETINRCLENEEIDIIFSPQYFNSVKEGMICPSFVRLHEICTPFIQSHAGERYRLQEGKN